MEWEVVHTPGLFVITLDYGVKAFLRYSLDGDVLIIELTYTPEKFRGRGLAEELTRKVVEYAKIRKLKIRPQCSYAAMFFSKHPEFQDLLE
jgi:predicted GNAT family acetyltransferase